MLFVNQIGTSIRVGVRPILVGISIATVLQYEIKFTQDEESSD
jgi:hypothetical protein